MAVKELTGNNIAKLSFNSGVTTATAGAMATDSDLDSKFGLSGQYYAKYKVTNDEKTVFICSTIASSTGLGVVGSNGYGGTGNVILIDTASTTNYVELESAKFIQDDGYIYFYCNNAGTVSVLELA